MDDPASRRVAVFAPTTLVTVTVERSATGQDQLHVHVGGQGVWTARMVARLGVPVTLCTTFGGETGEVARSLLGGQGIDLAAVDTEAWNGGYVHDRRSGHRLELADVAPGPLLRHELDDLYSTTIASSLQAGVCVLTGTHLHPVVADDVYARLARDLRSTGVDVVSDLSGGQLEAAIDGGTSVVKVSLDDLRRDGRLDEFDTQAARSAGAGADASLDRVIDRLARKGADVVVSCAEQPTRALMAGVRRRVIAPTMEAVDHRGAGDAMTAALAVGRARHGSPDEVLRMAAAAGAATVVRHGYATGTRESVEALARLVRVVDDPIDPDQDTASPTSEPSV